MKLLVLSLLALLVAPLFQLASRTWKAAAAVLDGFVLVSLCGIVALHVLPHSHELAGGWAILAAVVGLLLPILQERVAGEDAFERYLPFALAGIGVHAFLDGVALGEAGHPGEHGHEGEMLGLAVVLHRVPDGLAIWVLIRPIHGSRAAGVLLATVAAATVAGFFGGERVLSGTTGFGIGLFQAFVAGSLLHVVLHQHRHDDHAHPPMPVGGNARASAVGALAAVALLYALSLAHPVAQRAPGELGAGVTFLSLWRESAPALLLAFVAAGAIQTALGSASLAWLGRGGLLSQSLRGVAFGLPLPLCSCGVVPIYRSLVKKGAAPAAAAAFLVAAPEIGVDAALLSLSLLGRSLTVARIVAAAVVALVAGLVVGRLVPVPRRLTVLQDPPPVPPGGRVAAALKAGLVDLVDHTGPWILLGLGAAALAEPLLRAEWLTRIPPGLDVPLFGLLGLPTYVCAAGATPFVAVLLHKGLSPGAAIAFLLTGPATNLTTFGTIRALHGRRTAIAFSAAVGATAVGLGWLVNACLPRATPLELHELPDHAPALLGDACAVALGVVFLASLFRQGPRGLLAQIFGTHEHAAKLADVRAVG